MSELLVGSLAYVRTDYLICHGGSWGWGDGRDLGGSGQVWWYDLVL